MEEQTLSVVLKALRKGQCIAILDSKSEVESDLFFLVASFSPLSMKTLKTKARMELYIFVAHEVICTFSFPFIGEKYPILQCMGKENKQMCQSSCSVGFLFDHRSLKIGVSNVERIFTCHWLVKLWQKVVNLKNEVDRKEVARLFAKFHTPSHIFLCTKNASGLQVWNGHIELSVVLAKLVGIVPILDGDDFGALPPEVAKVWALGKNIPFLIGLDIINVFQGGARS
ncbi:unnamed protein product [Sphagnum troendelagicum]|uniref:Uncharacterized protein n=1 Tax=Sphagnum troendelagicum TaxID=128251 RepID=A0ABP0V1K6_9BRYO